MACNKPQRNKQNTGQTHFWKKKQVYFAKVIVFNAIFLNIVFTLIRYLA